MDIKVTDDILAFIDRWRGENVSTLEVSNVLNKLDAIQDTNIYGVEIPGIILV